jgi:site-specific DNA recombinase
MPVKAAIYVRISRDSSGERAGVDLQEKECRALAKRKGWEVADIYSDPDVSAWSGKARPDYQRMMKDIRDGKVNAIVAWHLDRLTRTPRELEDFLLDCDNAGVKNFGTVSGDIDLGSRDGLVMARILGAIARKSSDDASARIRAKFDQKAAKGEWKPTYYRPYGYNQVDGKLVIHEGEAAVVREIAKRVLGGESRTAISRDLHARGLRTSTGKPWSVTRMAKLLRSPTVTALRIHRGEVFGEGSWDPILGRDTWEKVGAKLRRTGGAQRGRQRHVLTGVVRCGRCREKLSAKRRTDGAAIYKCQSDSAAACGSLSVVASPVERIAADTAFTHFPFKGIELKKASPNDTEYQAVRVRLADLAEAEADITGQRVKGTLGSAAFVQAIREVADERDALEKDLVSIERTAQQAEWTMEATRIFIGPPDSFDGLPPEDIEWWRNLVGAVFEQIVVDPAGKGSRFAPERVRLIPRQGFEAAATPVLREVSPPPWLLFSDELQPPYSKRLFERLHAIEEMQSP